MEDPKREDPVGRSIHSKPGEDKSKSRASKLGALKFGKAVVGKDHSADTTKADYDQTICSSVPGGIVQGRIS